MNYQLIESLMGGNEPSNINGGKYSNLSGMMSSCNSLLRKKEKGVNHRDRFIGTVNQTQYHNSIALCQPKQTISKHKNSLRSHKISSQNNYSNSNAFNQINNNNIGNHNNNSSTNNSQLTFQSPINVRARARLQNISVTGYNTSNNTQPFSQSSSNLSPSLFFPEALSSTNLSLAPPLPNASTDQFHHSFNDISRSLTHLPNHSNNNCVGFRLNPISFQANANPYSSTAMDQEEAYDQDEIIESKEIQEELQDEQTCKYIQLLKRGFEESPLSKGSPFQTMGTNQRRKILNFSTNEISDDMKKAFSLHSMNNLNDKTSNMGTMNSFILSTINDTSDLTQLENSCSSSSMNMKMGYSGIPNLQKCNYTQPPQMVSTIELRTNTIEEDFYQNILDWSTAKKVAAIVDNKMIHLTDFKEQKNDALLSNAMQQCNIDFLPHFQLLLNHHMTSNFQSIQSWSMNSSTHFLSSQKKQKGQNHLQQSGRYDSVQAPTSSSHLNAGHSMNTLNINQIEDTDSLQEEEEEQEGEEEVEQFYNFSGNYDEFKMPESMMGSANGENKKDHTFNESLHASEDNHNNNINISTFNLNTPSPSNEETKEHQNQSSMHSSGVFTNSPSIICATIQPSISAYYSVLKFSPSGNILAAGRSDGVVEVYDVEKKQPIYQARCHTKLITAISINSQFLATASQDSKVVILNIKDTSKINLYGYLSSRNSSSILSLEWNPLSEFTLAASTESGHINLYNLLKDNKCSYKEVQLRESGIKTIAWNPHKRGILLAGSLDGFIFLINLEKKQLLQRKKVLNHIYKIIFSPNQVDRFVCLTGIQPESNNLQNRNHQPTSSSTSYLNSSSNMTHSNIDIINDNFGLQTGNMYVLSYPQINKIHQVQIGQKRVCQGVLSHDGSTLCTLSKDNILIQWKVFREPLIKSTNVSILTSAQELR